MSSFARTLFGAAVLLALAPPVRGADLTFSAVDRGPSSPFPYTLQDGRLEIHVDPALGDTLTFPPSVLIRGPLTITALNFSNVNVFIGEALVAAGPSIIDNESANLTLVAPVGGVPVGSPLHLSYTLVHPGTVGGFVFGDVRGSIGGFAGAPPPPPVPEPASLGLLTSGLAALALRGPRRSRTRPGGTCVAEWTASGAAKRARSRPGA